MARTMPTAPQPPTTSELFANVRHNYFRLYFHYIYFNVARYTYLQADNIFSMLMLGPIVVAAKITLGALNQISNAFGRVTPVVPVSWSTPGRRSSSCCRSTSACAPSRRRWRVSRCREIDSAYLERQQAGERRAGPDHR